jgi:hypothetical protein
MCRKAVGNALQGYLLNRIVTFWNINFKAPYDKMATFFSLLK